MMTTPIKRRNMLVQFLLAIVTFGIYCIYWHYSTMEEMARTNKSKTNAALMTVLLFIPFANFYAMYIHASELDVISKSSLNKLLGLALYILFSPAYWIVCQLELNKLAEASASSGMPRTA
jgi:hypothetical protein